MTLALPDIVLGIDQARRSGWGIANARGAVTQCGVARTHAERRRVAELVREHAAGDMRRVLVLLEDHAGMPIGRLTRQDRQTARKGRSGAPERSTATLLGMGAARGRWEAVLDELGHPEALRDEVEPRVWRAKLGIRGAGTDALKADACRWATAHLGQLVDDGDLAEGVCITAFGAWDGIARVEARRREARLKGLAKREGVRQGVLGLGERGEAG